MARNFKYYTYTARVYSYMYMPRVFPAKKILPAGGNCISSVAVPIPALASVSVLQSAAVGGSVVDVVGPL